jgi:hypothetical protein
VRALVQSDCFGRLRDLELRGTLSPACLHMLATWPRLRRLDRLQLEYCRGQDAAQVLAESPHLSPLTHCWVGGLSMLPETKLLFADRLGRRFHP